MDGVSGTWTPAVFRIVMGHPGKTVATDTRTHDENVEGETWGPFGINAKDDGPCRPCWFVTHLPTGRLLVEATSRKAAQRFCEEVDPLTDWSSVVPGRMPPDIKDAVLTARDRARGGRAVGGQPAAATPARERVP